MPVNSSSTQTIFAPPPAVSAEKNLDRSVVRSVVTQGVRMAVQTGTLVILARLVDPGEYGKYALLAPFLTVLSVVNGGGLSTAAITSENLDRRLASNLHWMQLVCGGAAALVLALLSPFLARLYGVPDLTWIGLGLAISIFAAAFGLQPRAALSREMKIEQLAAVDIIGSIAGLAAACLATFRFSGVALLVVSTTVTAAASSIAACIMAPVPLQRFAPTEEFKHAVKIGWHLIGADLLNLLRAQAPAFIIGFFVVLSDVGIFNRANQLVALPLTVLAPALTNFLLPSLSRARDEPSVFRAHIRRTLKLFFAISVPASIWIAVGPAGLIGLIFGHDWVPMVPILRLLSPLFGSQIVATVVLIALKGVEKSHVVRRFSFFNLVLTVVCVLAAAKFGVDAIALAMAFSALCLRAPLLVWLAIREGTIETSDLFRPLAAMVTLGLISAAALGLVRLLPLGPAANDSLGLVAVGFISLISLWLITKGHETGFAP